MEGPRRGASPRDRRRRARPDRRGTRWPAGPGSGATSSSARTSRRVSHTPGRDTPGGIVHGHGRARAYPPSPARAGMKVRSETAHFFPPKRKSVCFSFQSPGRASAIMADEGGGSRLDRLLRLLETGSSPAARHEAARQIGELASAHPNQLPNLLRRVRTQIRNRAGARPPRRVRFALRRRSRGPTTIRAGRPRVRARARGHDDETPSARVRIHVCEARLRYRRRRD